MSALKPTEILKLLHQGECMSYATILEKLKDAQGFLLSEKEVQSRLQDLVRSGLLEPTEGGSEYKLTSEGVKERIRNWES